MAIQQITDPSDLRKYRTELPNIIDDLALDVFERALYGHYKRVCGANGGTCNESTRTTADKIAGMSAGQVSIVRRRLAEKGLITEVNQHTIHVKIIDIWELNFAYYSVKNRPDITGWTIPQLDKWISENVYHINSSEDKCLPGEQGVYEVNRNGEKCLPGKTKNKPYSKNQPTEETIIPIALDGHQRAIDQASGGISEDPSDEAGQHLYWGFMEGPVPIPRGKKEWGKWHEAGRRLLSRLPQPWDLQVVSQRIDEWFVDEESGDFWKRMPCKDEALDLIAKYIVQAKGETHPASVTAWRWKDEPATASVEYTKS